MLQDRAHPPEETATALSCMERAERVLVIMHNQKSIIRTNEALATTTPPMAPHSELLWRVERPTLRGND
jgi:hypothetical protein